MIVYHDPVWQPATLRVDAAGNTRPGFECVHPLENGCGPCGGNVFRTEDDTGRHSCDVPEDTWVTEWAVRITGNGTSEIVCESGQGHDAFSAYDDWRRDCDGHVELVTCQVFRTSWQPLPTGDSE